MHSNQKQTPAVTKNKLQNKKHNTNAPVSHTVGGRSRQAWRRRRCGAVGDLAGLSAPQSHGGTPAGKNGLRAG